MGIRIFLFACLLGFLSDSSAQRVVEVVIDWSPANRTFEYENQEVQMPGFDAARHAHDNGYIPQYVGNFSLGKNNTASSVQLEVLETLPVGPLPSGSPLRANALNSNSLEWRVGEERGDQILMVSYEPIIVGADGSLRKVSKMKLIITETRKANRPKSAIFASNSVMANGQWFKIGVTEDGIHRINKDFLSSIGINVANLVPSELNIYGNGFGQLPFENSVPRPDDLLPNAIHIEGESDGVFNDDDYILFYAKGPNTWTYDPTTSLYNHQKHDYVDTSYYFIGIGTGNPPTRISNISSSTASPNVEVNSFDDYVFHEVARENLIRSGREWFGEKFDVQTTYNFSGARFTFPNIIGDAETVVRANVVGRTTVAAGTSRFTMTVNGASNSNTVNLAHVGTLVTSEFGFFRNLEVRLGSIAPGLNINLTFEKNVPSAVGWLNWLSVNTRRSLQMAGAQMHFRDKLSFGPGNIARFSVSNLSAETQIWDVTQPTAPKRIQYLLTGNVGTFTFPASELREYIAFTGTAFLTPVSFGAVQNQNLHAIGTDQPVDMIIVSPASLMTRAEELADIHRNYELDPLNVRVVRLNEIYNEFSSGMRDVTAIKWLMKMLYDRAADNPDLMPKYLLLFGDGSYDNRNSTPGNTNLLPTFQSLESLRPASSYVSDDYFAFLSDDEGEGNFDLMDVGVGRLVVKNNQEATSVVNKIRRYIEIPETAANPNCSICNDANTNLGAWRNIISLVADDEDGNIHMRDSRDIAIKINNYSKKYNIERIFIDAFQQIATPGGSRYPDVNAAIDRRVRNGAFIINYIGHGGETGWAQERILDIPMIQSWDNSIAMPIFMTATCQFSRFDDPLRTSGGELVLLNGNGGGIALLTTTRLVYSGPNLVLNNSFYDALFTRPENELVTRLGDVSRETKNNSLSSGGNHRNFSLLGDPALPMAIPKYDAFVTNITDTLGNPIDTLKALGVARVRGEIRSGSGSLLTSFNGVLTATVFDREKETTTLANDGGTPFQFRTQEDVVYRGNADVVNGEFQFDFVLPKDISFAVDTTARISLYARSNDRKDASGYRDELKIGDRDPNAVDDGTGPELEIFLNDENFVFGGFTDESPTLIARVFDQNGINTVGTGIGHDITGTLDGDLSKTIILNDFYESDLNTYKSGRITYKFDDLEPGNHELKVKVWNVHNNSTETTTEFIVANSEKFAIERLLNYPNPFTTHTEFFFEHNQSCEFLNVKIEVFTVSGKLVKSIVTVSNTDGFRNEPIPWNGRDDFGDRLATGVYVYKISVQNPAGDQVKKFEKLVILN